jgi:hypothetical protein
MRSVSIIFLILSSFSCTRKAEFTEPALAKVGPTILLKSEAKANIPTLIFQNDSIGAYTQYTDKWIEKQILLQEAYRLRIHRKSEIMDRLEQIESDYIAKSTQEYILAELGKDITVTENEARSYYQENKDSFVLEERYIRFRHLIASSLKDANDARSDIMKGISWNIVLDNFSINPDVALRESERFWPESLALSNYEILNRYLQLIGKSEISIIEKIGDEYHFVQLLEERAAGDHPDLEWLIDQITDWLILEKKRIAFNTYLKNLYLQAQANNEIKTFDVQN